jgi:hypothetical protein
MHNESEIGMGPKSETWTRKLIQVEQLHRAMLLFALSRLVMAAFAKHTGDGQLPSAVPSPHAGDNTTLVHYAARRRGRSGAEAAEVDVTSALGEWDDQRYDRRETSRDPGFPAEKSQARNGLVSGGGARKFGRDGRGRRAILHAWGATSPEGR